MRTGSGLKSSFKSLAPEDFDDEVRWTKDLADTDFRSPDAGPVRLDLIGDRAPAGIIVGE